MKKLYTILVFVLFTATLWSQSPQKMSYQAVIRDASNKLISNHAVGMRISILQGLASGSVVYTETQMPITNTNGLVSIEIGGGTGFNTINWAGGPYFIKTETDPTGGSTYSIIGSSQLMSVPYALYAANGGTPGPQGPAGANGTNGAIGPAGVLAAGSAAGNTPFWNGSTWIINNSNIYNNGSSIGIGTSTPKGALDITSSTNGVLIPRISLTSRNAVLPVVNPQGGSLIAGTLIWNTTTAGSAPNNVIPGYYYWSGSLWMALSSGAGSDWSMLGNSGTNPATNFIGTTDNNDLIFKRNNSIAGQLGATNTSYGLNALNQASTGSYNTATGFEALFSISTGLGNTANGVDALYSNTTGSNNTSIGTSSLFSNTTGSFNSAVGVNALFSNTEGYNNTAFGGEALYNNTIGYSNIAIGKTSLRSNLNGTNNIAIGTQSMYTNTSGNENTAIGVGSLEYNNGNYNTATGYLALFTNATGTQNTANGHSSLFSNTTGTGNTATGFTSLFLNTTGNSNTASGFQSLYANTTGAYNTAIGGNAMRYNSVGNNNTAIGDAALFSNTTGGINTATGGNALNANTSGFYNTANGYQALYLNTTGNSNTADGNNALNANTTGNQNTAVGSSALEVNTTGNFNTALGNAALNMLTSGVNNIGIGYAAQVPTSTGSNQVRVGNTFITYAGIQVAWTITSDKRLKKEIVKSDLGMNFIKKLNPVSYIRLSDKSQKKEYGFIAQELEETLTSFDASKTGMVSKDDDGLYSIRYNDLIAPMVKAMQEQQNIIEEDKTKINLLVEKNKQLENRLSAIEKKLAL